MELYYMSSFKRLAVQYLAVRRVRNVVALLAVVTCCAVIYSRLRYQKSTVSAVGCKSKIAQVKAYPIINMIVE